MSTEVALQDMSQNSRFGAKEERWTQRIRTGHKADGHYFWAGILGNTGSCNFRRVEVWGVVLL